VNSLATYYGTPAITSDLNIVVADSLGTVHQIRPSDGQTEWSEPTDGSPCWCTPAIGAFNEVYAGTNAGRLYAFEADGDQKWFLEDHTIATGMAVSQEGIIFAPLTEGTIVGLKDLGSSVETVFSGEAFGGAFWGAPCLDMHNGKPRLIAGDAFDGLKCWEKK
jgi:outer membrane protein assembly factor BamB